MSAASPSTSRHDTAVYLPKEVDRPNLSKAQKKRRRLGRGRARAKLRQEEAMMHAASQSDTPEDEQSPSAVSSKASSEAGLEATNDYYRQIVAARSTGSQAEGVQEALTRSSPAPEEEILVDLREVDLGESASSRLDMPDRNHSSPTLSTSAPSIPDTGESNDIAQEVAAPKWSKSQKKRRRQGKKRRALALAKLCQQEQPEFASSALDTREGGKSSLMTSADSLSPRDTETIGGVQLINDQAGRHPWAQAGRQSLGSSIPTTSDPNVPECGQGLSKPLILTSSELVPMAERTSAFNLVDSDLSKSLDKPCRKASQSDRGLLGLPVEIQLQILETCVVNSRTCVELIAGQTFRQFCDHNGIALAILCTCRLYWEEGSATFRERNHFALRSSQAGQAFIGSLKLYSRALPNLQHLRLRYTILGCSNYSMQAVAAFSRTVRFMPTLETLDIELESRRNWICPEANDCEHYLPIEEAFKDLYEKGDRLKADQCRLRRITLSGRSWTNEMRIVTLSGEPCSDLAPILADRLLPALREVRFGTSSE